MKTIIHQDMWGEKMARRKSQFEETARDNNFTWIQYAERLQELSVSMFEWQNLPSTVDPRYMELQLYLNGSAVYFKDDIVGDLCLSVVNQGRFNVYGEPINRRAYSRYNNYQKNLTIDDSVVIWNNMLRTNSVLVVRNYAKRLWEFDRIIDINVKSQKTPILLQGTEQQRLTLMQLYMKYSGNEPFIFGDKNLDINSLKVLKTDAPYIADKIQALKTQIWNEALTYLGIPNVNVMKKERLLTDEVSSNQGSVYASRYSRLKCRQQACDKINKMFGTNIWCEYTDFGMEDLEMPENPATPEKEGEDDE